MASTPRAQVKLDAVLGVHVAIEGAELAAEHALQRQRLRLDHGHLHAALARRGGDLAADPARADDTSRPPASSTARSASESSTVRRTWTPSSSAPGIGGRRGSAPVASSSAS